MQMRAANWKPAPISAPVAAFFSADAAIVHGELISVLFDRQSVDHQRRRLRTDTLMGLPLTVWMTICNPGLNWRAWLPKLLHSGRNRGRAHRLIGTPSGELTYNGGVCVFRKSRGKHFAPAIF
jgi:hypothetical protein